METIYSPTLDQRIDEISRQACRVTDDQTYWVKLGIDYANRYWSLKSEDRHPQTALRAALRLTGNSQQWLEVKYGFGRRLREINNMSLDEIEALRYGPTQH